METGEDEDGTGAGLDGVGGRQPVLNSENFGWTGAEAGGGGEG